MLVLADTAGEEITNLTPFFQCHPETEPFVADDNAISSERTLVLHAHESKMSLGSNERRYAGPGQRSSISTVQRYLISQSDNSHSIGRFGKMMILIGNAFTPYVSIVSTWGEIVLTHLVG